jgi:plasmid stabilization system protein ParE
VRRIEFTPEARRDLTELWEFITRDNLAAVDRAIASIEDALQDLVRMPGIGHTRSDVSELHHRFWRVGSYLIVYRFDVQALTVVRIIHGARDVRRLLGPLKRH